MIELIRIHFIVLCAISLLISCGRNESTTEEGGGEEVDGKFNTRTGRQDPSINNPSLKAPIKNSPKTPTKLIQSPTQSNPEESTVPSTQSDPEEGTVPPTELEEEKKGAIETVGWSSYFSCVIHAMARLYKEDFFKEGSVMREVVGKIRSQAYVSREETIALAGELKLSEESLSSGGNPHTVFQNLKSEKIFRKTTVKDYFQLLQTSEDELDLKKEIEDRNKTSTAYRKAGNEFWVRTKLSDNSPLINTDRKLKETPLTLELTLGGEPSTSTQVYDLKAGIIFGAGAVYASTYVKRSDGMWDECLASPERVNIIPETDALEKLRQGYYFYYEARI